MKHRVTVVGGGFAGMAAALQLAGQGCSVTVVEKEAAIGGFFPLLDNTYPTNSCGVCFLSPKQPAYCPFIECRLHDSIEIKVGTQITRIGGDPGDFHLDLRVDRFGVDQSKCIDCGDCIGVCAVSAPSEFDGGLVERKAIYKQYPKMVHAGYRVDFDRCTRCGACVEACPVDAVDLNLGIRDEAIETDALLLTPGFSLVDGGLKGEYGFGRYDNVVTSRQLERMISRSGPSHGEVFLPSDGSAPGRVAFIQCVGSRDLSCGRGYCSSVCCMSATKQAMFIRERSPETEAVIYYMDLRGMGKSYERYFNRARDEYRIEYRRSMVSTVREDPLSRKLRLIYDEGGDFLEDEVDLVVLSLGFDPPRLDFAVDLGLELDEYGFCKTGEYCPSETTVPGVFAAGAFRGPKDIPETVTEAAAAADAVLNFLSGSTLACGNDDKQEDEYREMPKEGGVWIEEPRIGVFLCACSGTMSEDLDFTGMCRRLINMPRVACAKIVDHACSAGGISGLRKFIGEYELNRIVVGACSVREMERLLDSFAREIGFNPNAFTVVNLLEQCLLPHPAGTDDLKSKASALVTAGVTKVYRNHPTVSFTSPVTQRALVVGGGAAGMNAALSLAARGYKVTIVEKRDGVGGRLLDAHYTLKGSDPRSYAKSLAARVAENIRIDILASAEVVEHRGKTGDYVTVVKQGETDHTIHHGVLVVATGAREASTDEYLYGRDDRVVNQTELEDRIASDPDSTVGLQSVMMIQCVGSREATGREYCSRVCCTHALKNALRLKGENPGIEVTVLYRDLRAYGLYEDYYRAAREEGVLFTPYDLESKPMVEHSGGVLEITYDDQILRRRVVASPDLLVLSTGIDPGENTKLAGVLNLPLDSYGFFAESNSKAASVDFIGEGRYHCGLASAPMHTEEALLSSGAAASRAATVLANREIRASKYAVSVNNRLCSRCGLCVEACPYDAREINLETNIAEVHYDLCHGCGSCAAVCPNGATQQVGFEQGQSMAVAYQAAR